MFPHTCARCKPPLDFKLDALRCYLWVFLAGKICNIYAVYALKTDVFISVDNGVPQLPQT